MLPGTCEYLDVGGIRTHFLDKGDGPVLLMLHGAGLAVDAKLTWFRQIVDLSRDHRVVAFDQVGFGRTDLPADRRYRNRLERVAHAIAFLKARALSPCTLVGHSEGGFIAARIAFEEPELVERLIIVASGSAAPMLGGVLDDQWMAASENAYNYHHLPLDEETFIVRKRGEFHQWDDTIERLYRTNFRHARRAGQWELVRNLPADELDPRSYMRLQEEHLQPILGSIKVPVALVWAANDATVPVERGVALMRAFADADLYVLSGAGHMVMHDRCEAFNALIRGWRRQDS